MHIAAGFVQQAQTHPEKLAVVIRTDLQQTTGCAYGGDCSYGELLDSAQRIAQRIAELGQRLNQVNDDPANHLDRSLSDPASASSFSSLAVSLQNAIRVGLLLPNGIEFLQIFLGATIGGGIAIVLDPQWPVSHINQILQSHPLDLLFVDLALHQKLTVPANLQVVVINSGAAKSGLADFALANWDATSLGLTLAILPCPDPIATTDAFYVGFTSGTTGQAKGVVRSHRSWVSSFIASQIEFGTNATDRILVPGSLVHSLSLYAVLEGLNAGATVYLLPQFSPKVVLNCLQMDAITMLTAVPTWLRTIAKAIINQQSITSRQSIDANPPYANLRAVIAGGAKLEPTLRTTLSHLLPNADILEYFGALELSFIAIAASRQPVPLHSVGRSFASVTVSIRRQDGSGEAEVGEIGWIGVKSPMLSAGYWYDSDLANYKCSPDEVGYRIIDGWATVGDLGWQDAEGYLYLVGREQEMLVSGGVNLYPTEIESTLRSFPEIDEVVVFGIPDPDRGQAIAAAIRWTGSSPTQACLRRSELLQRLQTLLPRSKCPRYFFTVDRFPLTSSGKVMRTALREQCLVQLRQRRSESSWHF